MSSEDAISYLESILIPDDTMPIKTLLSRLYRAPPNAQRYFSRNCKNPIELQNFLVEYTEYFFVENKKVALFDNELETAQEMSEQFFKIKVQECHEPLHYMEIKRRYIDGSSWLISSFIARFYPGEEFKNFFKNRPDIFVLLEEKVYLIEEESLQFYKKKIITCGTGHYRHVRGYISQAPIHIQSYVNRHYLDNDFRFFIEQHSDVFRMNESGNVTLVEQLN